MYKAVYTAFLGIALSASGPALAQGHGGGGGGGGGGAMGQSGGMGQGMGQGMGGGMGSMDHGMGAGPPISPPGQMGGAGASDRAAVIAAQRGQFGRDFAAGRHLSPTQYQAMAQQHRSDAMVMAKAARSGAAMPEGTDARIREALKQDMESWRDTFKVDRQSWQTMRDKWLVDRKSLSPQQWAEQRASWFAARDQWIANQRQWANEHAVAQRR